MKKKVTWWDAAEKLHEASLKACAHDVIVAADLLSAASAKLTAAEKVFYREQKKAWDRWEERHEDEHGEIDWSDLKLIKRSTRNESALTDAYEQLQNLSIAQYGNATEVRRVGQLLERLLRSSGNSGRSSVKRRAHPRSRSKRAT